MADVAVDTSSGEVSLLRVTVGQDAGLMINPAGVRHQVEGNVVQTASRVLTEQVTFDQISVATREWGAYPITRFEDAPAIDSLLIRRDDAVPLGVGESAAVPSAAAIANAIFDATGVRLREVPFTPERVRAALAGRPAALPGPPARAQRRWRGWAASAGAALAGAFGMAAVGLSWHAALPRIGPLPADTFSASTLARGKLLFAQGACAVCHTAPGGAANAGGRPIETPFGTVWSTNLTADRETGLGGWSFEAFVRAMRHGIGRDGRHLYPAFPYTSFARLSEADLQALYAYTQTLPAVRAETPPAQMLFPANLRAGMAVWNGLFHDSTAFQPDPSRSAEWNRGAYLVAGVGHCGACHTPRNALGAEKPAAFLAGAVVDGWHAPALDGTGPGPLRWTEADYYNYLRHGVSVRHGAAGGPMLPVIEEWQAAPDTDIRAMAVYLASLSAPQADPVPASALEARLSTALASSASGRARLFDTACGVRAMRRARPPWRTAACAPGAQRSVHADSADTFFRAVLGGLPGSGRVAVRDARLRRGAE